jgi:biotin carboxylase
MKNTFKMNDVPCPWFSEVKSEEELRSFTSDRENQKYVIKPTDGSGARGVLLIDENTDLSWAYKESKSWSLSGKIIIEKFEEGMQLSTESFILNNKCFTPALAERNYARLNQFKPYIIEDGGTIPAIVDKKLTEKISSLILDGAHAMGISKGVVKGDIVINKDGEPLIIELAARLSGGWLSTHQIPAATGVDLVNAVMSEALDIEVSEKELTTSKKKATAIRYFFPEKGKILSIEGLNELKNSHGVIKFGIFKNVGELQPEVQMHPDRFGYVLVEGSDRKNAIKLVKDAMSKLKIGIKK